MLFLVVEYTWETLFICELDYMKCAIPSLALKFRLEVRIVVINIFWRTQLFYPFFINLWNFETTGLRPKKQWTWSVLRHWLILGFAIVFHWWDCQLAKRFTFQLFSIKDWRYLTANTRMNIDLMEVGVPWYSPFLSFIMCKPTALSHIKIHSFLNGPEVDC